MLIEKIFAIVSQFTSGINYIRICSLSKKILMEITEHNTDEYDISELLRIQYYKIPNLFSKGLYSFHKTFASKINFEKIDNILKNKSSDYLFLSKIRNDIDSSELSKKTINKLNKNFIQEYTEIMKYKDCNTTKEYIDFIRYCINKIFTIDIKQLKIIKLALKYGSSKFCIENQISALTIPYDVILECYSNLLKCINGCIYVYNKNDYINIINSLGFDGIYKYKIINEVNEILDICFHISKNILFFFNMQESDKEPLYLHYKFMYMKTNDISIGNWITIFDPSIYFGRTPESISNNILSTMCAIYNNTNTDYNIIKSYRSCITKIYYLLHIDNKYKDWCNIYYCTDKKGSIESINKVNNYLENIYIWKIYRIDGDLCNVLNHFSRHFILNLLIDSVNKNFAYFSIPLNIISPYSSAILQASILLYRNQYREYAIIEKQIYEAYCKNIIKSYEYLTKCCESIESRGSIIKLFQKHYSNIEIVTSKQKFINILEKKSIFDGINIEENDDVLFFSKKEKSIFDIIYIGNENILDFVRKYVRDNNNIFKLITFSSRIDNDVFLYSKELIDRSIFLENNIFSIKSHEKFNKLINELLYLLDYEYSLNNLNYRNYRNNYRYIKYFNFIFQYVRYSIRKDNMNRIDRLRYLGNQIVNKLSKLNVTFSGVIRLLNFQYKIMRSCSIMKRFINSIYKYALKVYKYTDNIY